MVGVSAFRGTGLHILTMNPSLCAGSQSFFSALAVSTSVSGSSSSTGAGRLYRRPDLAARRSSWVCGGRRWVSLGMPKGSSTAQRSPSCVISCCIDDALAFTNSRRHCRTGRPVDGSNMDLSAAERASREIAGWVGPEDTHPQSHRAPGSQRERLGASGSRSYTAAVSQRAVSRFFVVRVACFSELDPPSAPLRRVGNDSFQCLPLE